jgi:hypothetical protein
VEQKGAWSTDWANPSKPVEPQPRSGGVRRNGKGLALLQAGAQRLLLATQRSQRANKSYAEFRIV